MIEEIVNTNIDNTEAELLSALRALGNAYNSVSDKNGGTINVWRSGAPKQIIFDHEDDFKKSLRIALSFIRAEKAGWKMIPPGTRIIPDGQDYACRIELISPNYFQDIRKVFP